MRLPTRPSEFSRSPGREPMRTQIALRTETTALMGVTSLYWSMMVASEPAYGVEAGRTEDLQGKASLCRPDQESGRSAAPGHAYDDRQGTLRSGHQDPGLDCELSRGIWSALGGPRPRRTEDISPGPYAIGTFSETRAMASKRGRGARRRLPKGREADADGHNCSNKMLRIAPVDNSA